MPTPYTISSVLLSFFITLFVLPYWIKRAREHHLVGKDMHKLDRPEVAELGGLIVIFATIIGILSYIALHTFIYKNGFSSNAIMAATASLLIAMIIGLVDDILGWKIGLRQYQKTILSLLIALPMMVINAGENSITLPILGQLNLHYFFPLFIIPVGIVGASNAFNMIAGFNGLEARMGLITIGTLGWLSYVNNSSAGALLAACLFVSLLAFWVFNKYPAVVFPGDTLTYPVGAAVAIIAILGNIEKFGITLYILYLVEFVLKARGLFQKESFARVLPDGSLVNQYDKNYSLTHVAIALQKRFFRKATEKGVVRIISFAQLIIAALAILYFYSTNQYL